MIQTNEIEAKSDEQNAIPPHLVIHSKATREYLLEALRNSGEVVFAAEMQDGLENSPKFWSETHQFLIHHRLIRRA